MTTGKTLTESQRKLLHNLTRELFQTETSAVRHSRREAERLGDTGPARALRAVAEHAERVLAELPGLAHRNEMPVSKGGSLVGELFSQGRDKFADMFIDSERSYRGTLLGMRHGVDAFRMLYEFGHATGNVDLTGFCTAWSATRLPLVQRVDEELRWFAEHPDQAVRFARTLLPRLRTFGARTRVEQPA